VGWYSGRCGRGGGLVYLEADSNASSSGDWAGAGLRAAGPACSPVPQGSILDSNAAVKGSYFVNYSSSTNQYTAEYNSSDTVTSLYGQYKSYLSQNGWTVTGSLTSHPTFDAISATQNNDQLQVVISTTNKGSQAIITYVAK
jgi:hypothetical protein